MIGGPQASLLHHAPLGPSDTERLTVVVWRLQIDGYRTARVRRRRLECENPRVPSNELGSDLQPGPERIGLTQRLDEERRAIVAQASDLSLDELHAYRSPQRM